MNKGTLIGLVAERLGVSARAAEDSVDAVLDEVARALVRGESVRVTGFGSFGVVERAERLVRNPKTGVKVLVPADRVVRFRAGVRLLEFMRGEKTVAVGGRVIGKAPKSGRKGA